MAREGGSIAKRERERARESEGEGTEARGIARVREGKRTTHPSDWLIAFCRIQRDD